jgi:hypothetical protein
VLRSSAPPSPFKRGLTIGEYLIIYSAPKELSKVLTTTQSVSLIKLIVASAPGALLNRLWENFYKDHPSKSHHSRGDIPVPVEDQHRPTSSEGLPFFKNSATNQELVVDKFMMKNKLKRFKLGLDRIDEMEEDRLVDSPRADQVQPRHSDMFEVADYPPLCTPSPQFDFSKAVKADDAESPTFLWDDRIWNLGYHVPRQRSTYLRRFANQCPLTAIRDFSLRWWWRRVLKSLLGTCITLMVLSGHKTLMLIMKRK